MMTLTGPTPITNAVTEYTFILFWDIFPVGVVAVASVVFSYSTVICFKLDVFDGNKESKLSLLQVCPPSVQCLQRWE